MLCGAYLRAEEESVVTFSFVPRHEGLVTLTLKSPSGYPLGSFTLEAHEVTGIGGVRSQERRSIESILLPKGIYIQDGKKYLRK